MTTINFIGDICYFLLISVPDSQLGQMANWCPGGLGTCQRPVSIDFNENGWKLLDPSQRTFKQITGYKSDIFSTQHTILNYPEALHVWTFSL